ncbi:MAG TPA: DNA mismatch repair protein MutL, partial [Chryseosolibacter sp.]
KFDDERAVYAVVRSAVRQAIGSHNLTPAIDFNADVNIISKLSQAAANSNDIYFDERFSRALHNPNQDHWEKLYEQSANFAPNTPEPQALRFESSANSLSSDLSEATVEEKALFQVHNRYIMRQVRSGLMVMDQQFAHERILYEKFLNQLKNRSAESQQDLFPQTITLSAPDFALVMEMEQEIAALGFRLEVFGKSAILITGVPANLANSSGKALFEGLIEQFKINQTELSVPLKENLARSLARRAGIKAGQKLETAEMKALIDGLFACATSNYTPDGIPTFFIFELRKIESYFNRQ